MKTVGNILLILIGIVAAIVVEGVVVFYLWNYVVPPLFNLPPMTSTWQAIALNFLTWLLFGHMYSSSSKGKNS